MSEVSEHQQLVFRLVQKSEKNQTVLMHSRVRVIAPRYSHNHSVTTFPICMWVQCQRKDKKSRASLSCAMELPSGDFLSPFLQKFLLHHF